MTTIHVTAEDIANGRSSTSSCPIALAAKRALGTECLSVLTQSLWRWEEP